MSPQSRDSVIREILAAIAQGQIGLAAVFDESANGQYFINAQGTVAFTGRGAELVDPVAVSPLGEGAVCTTLANLTSTELLVVLDCFGEGDLGGVVSAQALTDPKALPAYFSSYCEASPATVEQIREALA